MLRSVNKKEELIFWSRHSNVLVLFMGDKMTNIYAIYEGNTCLYVGSSSRDVNTRAKEHHKDLQKGVHTNKTLQKAWNDKTGDWKFKLISSIDTDNSLLRNFYEMLYISFLRPKTNHCVIKMGRNMVNFQKVTEAQAQALINVIDKLV